MKTPLIERMEKAGAPKAWIAEVKHLQNDLESMTAKKDEYLDIIDILARQVEKESG